MAGFAGRIGAAELLEVVHVQVLVGSGTEADTFRHVEEYWSKDGRMLARVDPMSQK